jgi:hypothetical protein
VTAEHRGVGIGDGLRGIPLASNSGKRCLSIVTMRTQPASIALMRASKNSQADSLESIEWLQVSP